MDGYVSALCRHLEESASGSLSTSYWVDTVYFGGGTPSYLGEKRLRLLLKTIRKRFQVSAGAEVTLEANPDSLGDWRTAQALRQAGFAPYYLYRQKYMSGSFENIGWTRPGGECLYNIYIMSELCSILSFGAGGSTKLINNVMFCLQAVPHLFLQRFLPLFRPLRLASPYNRSPWCW